MLNGTSRSNKKAFARTNAEHIAKIGGASQKSYLRELSFSVARQGERPRQARRAITPIFHYYVNLTTVRPIAQKKRLTFWSSSLLRAGFWMTRELYRLPTAV